MKNLDRIPFPAYDLRPMNKYRLGNQRYAMMMTSRGCPFNCIFCASSTLCGKKWRARSAENVMEELRMLNNEFCVKEVEFMDDTFTLNKKRTEEICDLMIKEGEWRGNGHFLELLCTRKHNRQRCGGEAKKKLAVTMFSSVRSRAHKRY
nr:methyltransferase Fe-S oxidoreductase [uncultured archaeon GZfos3D4]